MIDTIDDIFHARHADPLAQRFETRSGFEQLVDTVEGNGRPLHIDLIVSSKIDTELTQARISRAMSGFADARAGALQRERDRIRRLGLKELVFGLSFLAVCLVAGGAAAALEIGPSWFRTFVIEGLVIVGWIALWHPVDMLFFERLPIVREQRILARIGSATVQLHSAHD